MTTTSPLLNLPAELRDEIYTLTFTSNPNEDEIDLLQTKALPPLALLQTCRQIHHEAKTFYLEACTRLLREGHFVIYGCTCTVEPLLPRLSGIPDHFLERIEHLRLEFRDRQGIRETLSFEMLEGRNGWVQEKIAPVGRVWRLNLLRREKENGRVNVFWRTVYSMEEAEQASKDFEGFQVGVREQMGAIWMQYQRSS